MAVFRVEKNRNYTVMSNVHLKDRGISLKAKGLLSVILSLPEDWNYTTRGLAAICKEGVDSIGAALRELESAGYLARHRLRDRSGRISDTEYVVYPASAMPIMTINNPNSEQCVDLYAEQSQKSEFLGVYYNGTSVILMGFNATWAHVIVDGKVGFILAKYLE